MRGIRCVCRKVYKLRITFFSVYMNMWLTERRLNFRRRIRGCTLDSSDVEYGPLAGCCKSIVNWYDRLMKLVISINNYNRCWQSQPSCIWSISQEMTQEKKWKPHDSWLSGQYSNPGTTENEAWPIITAPRPVIGRYFGGYLGFGFSRRLKEGIWRDLKFSRRFIL